MPSYRGFSQSKDGTLISWVPCIAGLVAQMVKNLPAIQEIQILLIPQRRDWLLTPVFLPGKSHGQRSLEVSIPWDPKE